MTSTEDFGNPVMKEALFATMDVAEKFTMSSVSGTCRYTVVGFHRILLDEATVCAGRARQAAEVGNRRAEVGATASAVLSAAAACETYLSEFVARAEMFEVLPQETCETIRNERDAAKGWKIVFRSRSPDYKFDACSEYRLLACLLKLRNHVAHRHSRPTVVDSWPPELVDCIRQGAIPAAQKRFFDWGTAIYGKKVALWATKVASDWFDLVEGEVEFSC